MKSGTTIEERLRAIRVVNDIGETYYSMFYYYQALE